MEDDTATPLTPAAKRRKYSPFGPPPSFDVQARRRSSAQGRMDPPPPPRRPSVVRGIPELDPSLVLPPLQSSEAKGVEAMVMTIPYLNKIRLLAKISPCFRPANPNSPAPDVRGAIVAVDGTDARTINQVTSWLVEELGRDGDYAVKVFQAPLKYQSGDMGEARNSLAGSSCFLEYLESVASWHRLSDELIKYITTVQLSGSNHNPSSNPEKGQTSPPRPLSTSTTTTTAIGSPSPLPAGTVPRRTTTTPVAKKRIPVALVPGYMLTHSNLAAAQIPINDAYAPLDHWQWVASLWRGIVGPDLTVWIKDHHHHHHHHHHASSASLGAGMSTAMGTGAGTSIGIGVGMDDSVMNRSGGVEVREDARALIVGRREGGDDDNDDNDDGKGEMIEARVLRRLAFEVGEFVRGGIGGGGKANAERG